jgi:hypothetical protein
MTPADLPACALLEAHFEAIRGEAAALPESGWADMPSRERYRGSWRGFLLRAGPWEREYPGVDFEANRAAAPRTHALLDRIPGARVAGFLRLDPGADLGLHTDERDDAVVRVHLALELPEAEALVWPVGTCRILDVREPHRAANPGSRPRLTFVVDVNVGRAVLAGEIPAWNTG